MNTHRNIDAWRVCRQLANLVYRVTKSFPPDERYGLTSQLRWAAVSAASNIAEGYARSGPRETAHGLSIAPGSLAEVDTLIAIAEDQGYLASDELVEQDTIRSRASQVTFGFLRALRR